MSDSISLTVPRDDEKALIAASTLLLTLAGKIPPLELDDRETPAPAANPERQAIADAFAVMDAVRAAGGAPSVPEHQSPAPVTVDTPPPAVPGVQSMSEGEAVPPTPPGVDPLTPAAPPPAHVPPGVEVDKNGLPWDARIHAGTKAKNADGTWRYKKGVDRDTEVPAVEQELRVLMAVPVAEPAPVAKAPVVPVPTPEPVTPAPVAEPPVPENGTLTQEQAGLASPPVPVPDAPAPTAEEAPTTFPAFLRKVTERINAGTLSMDRANAINAEHGIDRMAALVARPDLIPQIWNTVING